MPELDSPNEVTNVNYEDRIIEPADGTDVDYGYSSSSAVAQDRPASSRRMRLQNFETLTILPPGSISSRTSTTSFRTTTR